MKKLLLSLLLSASFGFCFAPINRGLVPPDQIQRELSEADRAKQQYNLPQIGNVGGVESGPGTSVSGPGPGDSDAANTVANAGNRAEGPQVNDRAKKDLALASQNMKSGAQKAQSVLIWALLLGILGFGIVTGLRKWADKAIPQPAVARKSAKW